MTRDWEPAELADRFADIERQLAALDRGGAALGVLADLAVQQVPGTEFAGVSRGVAGGRFTTAAATDLLVARVDRIQYDLMSGPCVDAILDDTVYRSGDIEADSRWPRFGVLAHAQEGITSMLAFRLYVEADPTVIASLNLYSTRRDAFTDEAVVIGRLLATHGALAIAAATAREAAGNLTIALRNSREIGVAIGILMGLHRVTLEQAFDLLRIASQEHNMKLSAIASDVVRTGAAPGRRRPIS